MTSKGPPGPFLTLRTLAERVAPDLWDAYRQAIDVHDRKSDPPPDWWPQIAADAEAFVERMLAERLRKFDTSDLWVASLHLRITSSWDLEAWKNATEDWPRQLAELRARRDAYESETRELLRETASSVVSAKSARDRVRVLGKLVAMLLRAGMTERGCVVRATPQGSARRVVDWAELREAVPDIAANALTIGGVVFSMVHVEPAGPAEVADPAVTKKERPTDQAIAAWAVAKQGELKATGRKHGRDVMVPLAAKHFGVKQDVVRLAWRLRPGTTGNKPDRL